MATARKTQASRSKSKRTNGVIASGARYGHRSVLTAGIVALVVVVGFGWFGCSQYRQNGAHAASCNTQPFKDVAVNNNFCGEIQWLKDKGVTSGYGDGTFRPSEAMGRGEMALTMYHYARLTGSKDLPAMPAVCTAAPYPDVATASPYCGAVTWMKAKGLTTGYEDGTYRPSAQLNRDAAAAFMYRTARLSDATLPAKPVCKTPPFTDVAADSMFCGEIQWLKDKKITSGYSDGSYHPVNSISHEAVAAFLYRAIGDPNALTPLPAPGPTPTPGDPGTPGNPTPNPGDPGTPNPSNPNPGTPVGAKATKLLVVMFENTSAKYVKQYMPRTVAIGNKYVEATNVHGYTRGSNGDYLAMAGGVEVKKMGPAFTASYGTDSNNNPPSSSKRLTTPSVFGEAIKNGKTAKVYSEDMPSNCQASDAGLYVVKHNPWPYFANEAADCKKFNVSTAAFDADVKNGTLPNAGFLIPNNCNNGHDCKPFPAAGKPASTIPDTWLDAHMSAIFSGPDWKSGNLIVLFTFDEPTTTNYDASTTVENTPVYTFIAHPSLASGAKNDKYFDLFSITRLYAEMNGTVPLGQGANATSFKKELNLPM